MKITKKKLLEIIKEEVELVLNEQARPVETSRMDVLDEKITEVDKRSRELRDEMELLKNILMELHGDQLFDRHFADRDKGEKTAWKFQKNIYKK